MKKNQQEHSGTVKKKEVKRMHKKWIRVISFFLAFILLATTILTEIASAKIKGEIANSIKEQAAQEYLMQGLDYLELNRYEKALSYLQATLDIKPDNVQAYMAKASVYIATAEYDKALKELNEAIKLYGDDVTPDILLQVASIHVLQGDVELAIPILEKITTEYEGVDNAWLLLGQICYDNEEHVKAIECFDEYLIGNPDDVTARAIRAACRSAVGDEQGAMEDLVLAAKKADDFPEIRQALAQVYVDSGEFKNAAEMYEKIAITDPENVENHQALASCYLYLYDYDKALEHFKLAEKYLTTEEKQGEEGQTLSFSIATIEGQIGELESALERLTLLEESGFKPVMVKSQLADLQFLSEDMEEKKKALSTWENILLMEELTDADYTITTLKLADSYLRVGEFDKAIEYATLCLEGEMPDENARLYRALAYLEQEDAQKAIEDLDIVININPEGANAYYYRAVAKLGLNEVTAAKQDLQICMQDEDETDIVTLAKELYASLQ